MKTSLHKITTEDGLDLHGALYETDEKTDVVLVHVHGMAGNFYENKFLDLLELSYIAYFTEKEKKVEKISECVLVLDTLKFLISVAWEGKFISNAHCEQVTVKLEEVGKMFGGWKKNLGNPEKKNRSL